MGSSSEYTPLFETKRSRGRVIHRTFAISLFVAICFIWIYRLSHIPRQGEVGKWTWFGLLGSELWFGLYWLLTQALRWNLVFRHPFTNRLSQRYDYRLPEVDIFVCTADAEIEPPMMVINTVLSVMAYDYPAEKVSVYLSDDGGSEITFYALLEASNFAKHWIPFCKRFNLEPRAPASYFNAINVSEVYANQPNHAEELTAIKPSGIQHMKKDGPSNWTVGMAHLFWAVVGGDAFGRWSVTVHLFWAVAFWFILPGLEKTRPRG